MLANLAGVSDHEVTNAIQRVWDGLRRGESHLDDAVANHAEYIKQQVRQHTLTVLVGADDAPWVL